MLNKRSQNFKNLCLMIQLLLLLHHQHLVYLDLRYLVSSKKILLAFLDLKFSPHEERLVLIAES